ncbi:ABC transporter permease [Cetobacterium sp. 8H]|uniref:ABC transporter permease n=1 Tax=Cetobacterium sp. 8H TaxID=2759681 RepID=UPI00163D3515|nr:ABC transporter permease [Cetobacterium sp. 8H]MBC2851552.1 ABC transporter permease [Cetobacterium sp. 8H]
MTYLDILKGAVKSLRGNKIRSFLTMLGIIIGISSVITMSAIGRGGQRSITGNLKDGGYGKFTVSVDKSDVDFRWKNTIDNSLIKMLEETDEFKEISPEITSRMTIKIGNRREFVTLEITNPSFERIQPVKIIAGRGFVPFDYESGEKNIVIDNITAKQIFKTSEKAIGKKVDLIEGWKGKSEAYTVVGVMKNPIEDLAKLMGNKRIPRYMRIPLSTYEKIYDAKGTGYTKLIVESKDPNKLGEDMQKMKKHLDEITGTTELYEVNIKNTGADSFDKILTTLNIFVTFVAGISLFVGGIGVMNIMLVSVIERTKEIGIRKAIGATNKEILLQFLMESIILTGIGGAIGVIFGIVLGYVVGYFVNIVPVFSLLSIISALGISSMIGIIFGVTPAKKAAELNPIEALRSE